ncbi:PAS domain-containing sensor histidine kinase [Fodinisporobacter ferrooxydans]|uniref:histidine kinase n=1 Tax=Fodinisporobacter ferrooxydans TaxID=2901836 RepID=A0ABY4CP23_9BACL|nr:PAS domain-containing sensor histidine kinase [Alicyclobacillaceae bacterium MYW30-H2]
MSSLQDFLSKPEGSLPIFESHVFRHVFEYAADGYIILDEHMNVLYMNQTAKTWFGDLSMNHPIRCNDLLHCHDGQGNSLKQSGCYGQCVFFSKSSLTNIEMNVKNLAGEERLVSVSYSYIPSHSLTERIIMMSIRDITDAKQFEAEKRKVEKLTYTIRERERLARDLHDTVAQDLAFANMKLKVIEQDAAKLQGDKLCESIHDVSVVLDDCLVELRHTLRDLNFSGRDLHGFVQNTVRTFEKRTGIQIKLYVEGTFEDLDVMIATQVARLLQESLANIRKHAKATIAILSLIRTNHMLKVMVSDNGIGFDPDSINAEHHFGLRSMRERCAAMHARAVLDAKPGKGTTWTFEFDL